MKRHWEVPQQACVIPPIFDKRFFEDDKAEIPKSIKAMEEERLRARQEEEEEAKRRREQKYELAATTGMSDVRDSGEGDSKEMKLIDDDQLGNTEAASEAAAAAAVVVPSHLRPLSLSKSSGGSATFLERRPRRLPFPKDHRFGCATCPVSPTSPLASPKLTSVSHYPTTTTMETSLQAAEHGPEQHSQWTTHMDRQQQSNNNNSRVRDHEDSSRRPPSPLYRSPLSRSMTSPCLVSAVAFSSTTTAVTSSATNGKPDHWMLIEPPVRTSSIQTPKSVTPSNKDRHRPLPPSIPSWARRFEMDDQYSSSNTSSRNNVHGYHNNNNKFGFYDDLDAQFGLSNGDDEVLVRGDEEAARHRRRWRRNTEERHAEWMETIKAGRWGQEDPRGWSNRLQRLKQHFQTVTGRPISPEDDAMTTITTGMTTTRALTVREEEHGHSKSDSEGSNGGRNVGGRIIRMRTAPKGGARHWFATNNRGTRSLRVVKEISKVDLPHLSKLWHPSN
ncbi:hypothetical protein BGW42_003146 [Actinomortierella wolfii]|nr:hypothetical protein BGW42_003146 [Actinomortierella wolfii]